MKASVEKCVVQRVFVDGDEPPEVEDDSGSFGFGHLVGFHPSQKNGKVYSMTNPTSYRLFYAVSTAPDASH